MQEIFTHAEMRATPGYKQQRWMLIGGDGTLAGQLFAKVAAIPQRTLSTVGGLRDGRMFYRRKAKRGLQPSREVTALMLIAVANEVARRRARNKAASKSRRVNRA